MLKPALILIGLLTAFSSFSAFAEDSVICCVRERCDKIREDGFDDSNKLRCIQNCQAKPTCSSNSSIANEATIEQEQGIAHKDSATAASGDAGATATSGDNGATATSGDNGASAPSGDDEKAKAVH